jgi:hypothetical protein
MGRKYSVEGKIAAESWGNDSNDALASPASRNGFIYTGQVYRRGDTNTRIYLLQEIINGFRNDIFLVYVPNTYFSAIHDEWWANFQSAQQEKAEKQEMQREQLRQADQKKIQ